MAREVANKIYRNFTKGFITEASELTYPENSTIAEDNCIIYRKGNRSRRLGFDIEAQGALSYTSWTDEQLQTMAQVEYTWESVANDSSKNFLCRQIGNALFFYDLDTKPLSAGLKSWAVVLQDYLAPSKTTTADTPISMASGKGNLYICGSNIEPLVVTYLPETDTFEIRRVYIQIRDFKGLDDQLANDQEPTTLTKEHHYNLRNQGWVDPSNAGVGNAVQYFDNFGNSAVYNAPGSTPVTAYFAAKGRYPGNNKQWWAARDATTNEFDPELLSTMYTGTTRAPRGHYVVDAFYIDRSAVSGVSGIPVEARTERPNSVAFFAGRVWYLEGSTVYFSQVLDDTHRKAGFAHQEADPTAEDISDLLPTDGGVIPIPELSKGLKLVPLGAGIVVFGQNGIWAVTGTSAGFTANDFSVSKVNPLGTTSPMSIVDTGDQVYWWSKVGIMGMSQKMGQFGPVDGVFDKVNITEETIQSFYNNDIPEARKEFVKGAYDPASNTVQWLYADDVTIPNYSYNRILNLDMTLQAFYPWSLSTTGGNWLTGIFHTPKINDVDHPQIKDSFLKFTFFSKEGLDNKYGFGIFDSTSFMDWKFRDGVGQRYLSFAETGYELLDDAMRKKATPWIFTYFRKTEENYVPDGDDYTVDKPSSCLFQVKWNWASTRESGKYSTKVEAYRHTRLAMFDESDLTFNTGYPLVVTKHKVRGVGKAIQFRFESDKPGHDFDLIGWAVSYTGVVYI